MSESQHLYQTNRSIDLPCCQRSCTLQLQVGLFRLICTLMLWYPFQRLACHQINIIMNGSTVKIMMIFFLDACYQISMLRKRYQLTYKYLPCNKMLMFFISQLKILIYGVKQYIKCFTKWILYTMMV